jgi:hypothetical protein
MAGWIILNGAPKCGSTWLVQLVKCSRAARAVPGEIQRRGWKNSSIDFERIRGMLELVATADDSCAYYTKQHWSNPAKHGLEPVLRQDNIVVCNIYRDTRDMLVSRYFHEKRLGGTQLELNAYVEREGMQILARNYKYHSRWLSWALNNRDKYVLTSYEALSDDLSKYGALFLDSILRKFNHFESQDTLSKWADETHFSRRRKTGRDQFFRKGKAFGWKDDLTTVQSEAILKTSEDLGYRDLKASMAAFAPQLSSFLGKTDVGISNASL